MQPFTTEFNVCIHVLAPTTNHWHWICETLHPKIKHWSCTAEDQLITHFYMNHCMLCPKSIITTYIGKSFFVFFPHQMMYVYEPLDYIRKPYKMIVWKWGTLSLEFDNKHFHFSCHELTSFIKCFPFKSTAEVVVLDFAKGTDIYV